MRKIITSMILIIDFYNKEYLDSHPNIVVEKKSKSPDEDKSLANSKALIPTLRMSQDEMGIQSGIYIKMKEDSLYFCNFFVFVDKF